MNQIVVNLWPISGMVQDLTNDDFFLAEFITTSTSIDADLGMDVSEKLIGVEADAEADANSLVTSALAAFQADPHVVEDFLFTINHGRAKPIVAHHIRGLV